MLQLSPYIGIVVTEVGDGCESDEIREGGEVKLPPPRAPLSHVFVCMPPGVENSREIAENSSTLCELFDR